ncbi:transposable element Tcb1 transposase [Trichonephila clavipes]|nr:transposable element Tcb1 transposase [Trichonephila clavipes]
MSFLTFRAWPQRYFNRKMRDHTLSKGSFVNHQIELLPWPARSPDLSPIENMWSMVSQRLTQIIPPADTPDQLWQRVEATWSAVSQEQQTKECGSGDLYKISFVVISLVFLSVAFTVARSVYSVIENSFQVNN